MITSNFPVSDVQVFLARGNVSLARKIELDSELAKDNRVVKIQRFPEPKIPEGCNCGLCQGSQI